MTSKQAGAASAGGGQQAAAPGLANASVTQAVVTGQLEGTFVGNGCICSPACCRECIRPAAIVCIVYCLLLCCCKSPHTRPRSRWRLLTCCCHAGVTVTPCCCNCKCYLWYCFWYCPYCCYCTQIYESNRDTLKGWPGCGRGFVRQQSSESSGAHDMQR